MPTKIVMDSDGVAHLLSSENDAIYRWSMTENYYLEPLEVGDEAMDIAYMEIGKEWIPTTS